ncbi:hypothetical protein C2869_03170 [Saccharobesus litoralis]|uniref:Uncharacterized protein n=1 Tax=Saccharobesus litoralis TaxID=2172099 RepID=A0A2S0VMR5_9ALTE|nr:hypothetical protein C2869_03170 [Saccharobesus litoralis]
MQSKESGMQFKLLPLFIKSSIINIPTKHHPLQRNGYLLSLPLQQGNVAIRCAHGNLRVICQQPFGNTVL